MMGYGWGMGFGWLFMGLFWVVVVGLVVWGVIALVPGARSGGQPRSETPEEILDRRFASGELDPEQYQRARQELASTRTGRR
ncbi:MAG TPA: SHOCT domain-containing protein [Pseudonocardiaceae bacterium]|nr:SHOCT domain-containing protein [Pseudonocardiaceae bacterium]